MITMQNNARSNLWKQDLIYEGKYDSKLICKCNDKIPWWKPWVQERMRQEDKSSPQKALMLKLLQKLLSKPAT